MAGLVIYRGEQLTIKQISQKYGYSQSHISAQINHDKGKLNGYEISWVISYEERERKSVLFRKEKFLALLQIEADEAQRKIRAINTLVDITKKDIKKIKSIC